MKSTATLLLDARRAEELYAALVHRSSGYVAEWRPGSKGPDVALARIFSRYLETVLDRVNQSPERNRLAMLDLFGLGLVPARAARAAVVFVLGDDVGALRLPAGAKLAAEPPAGESEQIVFETEAAAGLSGAQLVEVVSFWPGRDQYIDHTAALEAGSSFKPWNRADLTDVPHVLYLGHELLLALSGQVTLDVELELSQVGSEELTLVWQYWDGKVWREFADQRPECSNAKQSVLDGTQGLTCNGKHRLTAECTSTAPTQIDGTQTYWVRAVLDEPLPLDPDQILPEVSQVRITSVIEQPLKVYLSSFEGEYLAGAQLITGVVTDGDGNFLERVDVELVMGGLSTTRITDSQGAFAFPASVRGGYTLRLGHLQRSFKRPFQYFPPDNSRSNLELALVLQIDGLQPDSAAAGAEALDLSKPFYPLGQAPGPGSVFYFSSEEAFTKPGASLTLHIKRAQTSQDEVGIEEADASANYAVTEHRLVWEYWNGRFWSPLKTFVNDTSNADAPEDFTGDGDLEFTVPDDMALTTVNDEEALWMRARVCSGSFGFTSTASWTADTGNTHTFTFFVHRPPAVANLRLSYMWEYGPFHCEEVRSYNDFAYTDDTRTARWPGSSFTPFRQGTDLTPALYLGFDEQLPVDVVNLFADVVEDAADGPELRWEYWNGSKWKQTVVSDGTDGLLHPEMITFLGASDAAALARFGTERHWLRARLKVDGLPPQVELSGLYPNAVWVSQRETVENESFGVSTGLPRQVVRLGRIPVLDTEVIEVLEVQGARAAVEWRIKATELFGDEPVLLRDLEDRLGSEGLDTDVQEGRLRLRRDRNKQVSGVWVRWTPVEHFLASAAGDRHYVIERAQGIVRFGDGERGAIPALGAEFLAVQYRTGGGRHGNVDAKTINQLLVGAAGIDSVFNPRAAEGGADGEELGTFARRAPGGLRHRGRAVLPADFESMAKESSAAVAVAQVVPNLDPQGLLCPGWITVVILPHSDAPQPVPSHGLCKSVSDYLEARAPASLAASEHIHVTGPSYLEVGVNAVVAPIDLSAAGDVESAVTAALEAFLHPLYGGPEKKGWRPGRDVYLSDVASVVERIAGVDYVQSIELLLNDVPRGERVVVPDGKTVVVGAVEINLVV